MEIHILTVPYDSGRRDVGMGLGPARLLDEGLAAGLERAGHRVTVEDVSVDSREPEAEIPLAARLHGEIAGRVRRCRDAGRFPLVLSGPCHASLGVIAGMAPQRPAVIWFDSHADFNTPETSLSGFFDGMCVSVLTGRCWRELALRIPGFRPVPEERVVLLGVRDVDALERDALDRSAVHLLQPEEVPGRLAGLVASLREDGGTAHVHLDLDVLDPARSGPANRFAAPGGLSADAVRTAIGEIGTALRIRSAALTAYDPACDPGGAVARAGCDLALALIEEVRT